MGSRWRRSATPRRRGTGGWPPGCSPTPGPACIWAGRSPPSTSCWPGSRPRRVRPMWSWPRWPRPMSWPRGRWRRPSGTWRSRRRVRCRCRQGGDPPAVAEEARRLQAAAEAPDAARYDLAPAARAGLGEDLRALALINLGIAEVWAARDADAEPHLERGVMLAHRIGRPFLEFSGLAYQATINV